MNRIVILYFFLILNQILSAQDSYLIYFKTKEIHASNLALSQESVLRKKKFQIAIDDKDYQIEPTRILTIRAIQPNFKASKWLNAIYIEANESEINLIKRLDFIEKIAFLGNNNVKKLSLNKLESTYTIEEYGSTYPQLKWHNADELHNKGFEGQGMKIAVFDAGFSSVDTLQSLTHLFTENRIFQVKNLVENSQEVFRLDGHGTGVLGTMASFVKDTIIGSAPKANYYLFITENPSSETKQEEVNWAIAAEMADSIGIDIINSSLGYTEFDDPSTNYSKSQLDGETTISAIAAKIACEKGIIVVNSAGNAGNKPWHLIATPADAEDVITVGAIDINGIVTDFSSRGFNTKNIIKPSVMAVGRNTIQLFHKGKTYTGNGTSFSSPLMAGLVACFWQKNMTNSASEIRRKIYAGSSHFLKPTYEYGFGIPDFKQIQDIELKNDSLSEIVIYPNPSQQTAVVDLFSIQSYEKAAINVYHFNKQISSSVIQVKKGRNQYFIDLKDAQPGLYFVKIKMGTRILERKFEKL